MRKTLILLVVFAVIGAAAFADGTAVKLSASAWEGAALVSTSSATTLVPYNYNWVGTDAVRLVTTYTSADGNAGFNARLQAIDMTKAISAAWNQFNAWGKFFGGMLTVRAGLLDDYTIATPIWSTYGMTDSFQGIYFDLAPVAGLDIGFFQTVATAGIDSSKLLDGDIVGAAYSVKDIGKFEFGALLSSAANSTALYLGANVTAIAGVTLQLEGKYTLASTASFSALENLGYAAGPFSVAAYVGETYDGTNFDWGIEPSVSYKVTDAVKVAAIANVYQNSNSNASGLQTWMSPIDAGLFGGGSVAAAGSTPAKAATGVFTATGVAFGGGAYVTYTASGATLTLGDYYAAATGGGNAVYVNLDLAL